MSWNVATGIDWRDQPHIALMTWCDPDSGSATWVTRFLSTRHQQGAAGWAKGENVLLHKWPCICSCTCSVVFAQFFANFVAATEQRKRSVVCGGAPPACLCITFLPRVSRKTIIGFAG